MNSGRIAERSRPFKTSSRASSIFAVTYLFVAVWAASPRVSGMDKEDARHVDTVLLKLIISRRVITGPTSGTLRIKMSSLNLSFSFDMTTTPSAMRNTKNPSM